MNEEREYIKYTVFNVRGKYYSTSLATSFSVIRFSEHYRIKVNNDNEKDFLLNSIVEPNVRCIVAIFGRFYFQGKSLVEQFCWPEHLARVKLQ